MTPASVDHRALFEELKPFLISPKKGTGDNVDSFCPVHADGKAHGRRSLSLSPTRGLTCWAGCEFKTIIEALKGRPAERQIPHLNGTAKTADTGTLAAVYKYEETDGKLIAEKARFEFSDGKKAFKWRLPDGNWSAGIKPLTMADIPLWGAPLVAKAYPDETVYFCEGEKATQACRDKGLLAVTHGGGSSTREFGASLDILQGRHVALWPDNDAPGRQYMTTVQARLRGIAASVRIINVAVPEKGDAWDYFAAGGTVEALNAGVISKPLVEFLSDDAIKVSYPLVQGTVMFTCTDIERTPRTMETELSVSVSGIGTDPTPYSLRINLMSASAVTDLRRSLQEIHGKDGYEWVKTVNTLVALVREAYSERDPSIEACDIEDDPDEKVMLVDPILPIDSPSIFFGDGGSAKTYVLLKLAWCFALGHEFMGLPVPCMPVLFIDYEGNKKTFKRRLRRIAQGMGYDDVPAMVHYWPANGVPLSDMVYAIRRKVEKEGIGLLIVDSVAPACGGKPEDADVSLRYFRALQRIGCTSANIAHITKSAGSDYPFGSIFWHNESRSTWFVKRAQEEDADEIDVGLFNKKANEGPRAKPIGLKIAFDGLTGPVTLQRGDLRSVPDLQSERPARQQIWDVLTEAMDIDAIVEKIANDKLKRDTIYRTLTRNPQLFTLVRHLKGDGGGKPKSFWGRATIEMLDFGKHEPEETDQSD